MNARRIDIHRCGQAAVLTSAVILLTVAWAAAQTPAAPGTTTAPPPGAAATESFRSAVALQNRGLYDLAAAEWEALLQAHPNDPLASQARFHHGICLFQLEKYADAAGDFERILADGDTLNIRLQEQAQANLGLAQYNLGRVSTDAARDKAFDAALAAFQAQLERFPDGQLAPQAIFYRAETWYARGDLKNAIDGYRTILEKHADHPLSPRAMYGLAVVQQESNQPAEAGATFDQLLKKYPQHELAADAHLRRGETFVALDRLADAEAHFTAAAAIDGFADADRALEGQAECRVAAHDYVAAAALYAKLVKRFPDSELTDAAIVAEGKYRYLAKDYSAAINCLRTQQSRTDASDAAAAETAHWMTRALVADGQVDAALATVETALNRTPPPPPATLAQLRLDRADVLFELPKRRAEAIAHYAAVAREHPADAVAPQAAYMAAYGALAIGDAPMAVEHADEFRRQFPASDLLADVDNVAAEAQLQLGNHTDAGRIFSRLLREYPDHEERHEWLVRQAHCLSLGGKRGDVINSLESGWQQLATPELQAEAGLLLGNAYSATERPASAAEVLTAAAALPHGPQSDEILIALARAQQSQGQTAAAIATLSRLIDAEPQSPLLDRAFFDRGECYAAGGVHKAAAADFERLCDRWPDSPLVPHAMLAQARAEQRQQLLASAQGTLSRLISAYAHHKLAMPARLTRATVRHEMHRFPEALADIKTLLAARPARPTRSDALLLRGMCQVELDRATDAVQTFELILAEDADCGSADRVLYELAWAYDKCGKPDLATATFRRLATDHAASPLAAECWYRVGEAACAAGGFADAAECFRSAWKLAADVVLQEKAAHKLAWAIFSQGQFADAERAFTEQLTAFTAGPLAADARLMLAESRFARQDYDAALEAYTAALDGIGASPEVRGLGMLHAAQVAGQLEKWTASLALLDRCASEYPENAWADEIRCERGWALYHQQQWDAARKEFEIVAEHQAGELGARARFMLGEIQFARKQHDDAVRSFFKVAYGYGDNDAQPAVRRWQAEAMFEAARCLEQTERRESARKLYHELLTRFPDSDKATHARVALGKTTTR